MAQILKKPVVILAIALIAGTILSALLGLAFVIFGGY